MLVSYNFKMKKERNGLMANRRLTRLRWKVHLASWSLASETVASFAEIYVKETSCHEK